MKTNDLWSAKADCCGCEICSLSCPKAIITMRPDEEGFLYPHITHEEECLDCKRCIRVCPMNTMGRPAVPIVKGYGGYVNNSEELKRSASGGYATAVSRAFIQKMNGVVYGVRYSDDYQDVCFSKAETVEELESFRASKYVQAKKGDVFTRAVADLKQSRNVLFIGLPCEVSALYHIVGNNSEHLYTASLICHGPSSIKVHRAFCNSLTKKYSSSISFFSVRYKLKGWKPYYLHAEFENGRAYNKEYAISDYGIAFQYLKRPSCSVCKYKYANSNFGLLSDITLGDFHAVPYESEMYNKNGVSEVLVHTGKGQELIDNAADSIYSEELPMEMITVGNRALYDAIPPRRNRALFVTLLNGESLRKACSNYSIRWPLMKQYYRAKIVRFIKAIMK